jgi:hypothetical protein
MTAASMATVRVPADGPKRIKDRNTNVSETERATGIEYRRTGAEPLKTVRTARIAHSVGISPWNRCLRESHTLQAPATVIVVR